MEKNIPKWSPFDTTETYVYKLAKAWNTPTSYIISCAGTMTNSPVFLNVKDLIEKAMDKGQNLIQINLKLSSLANKNFASETRKIATVKFINDKKIDLRFINEEKVVIGDKKKEIEKLLGRERLENLLSDNEAASGIAKKVLREKGLLSHLKFEKNIKGTGSDKVKELIGMINELKTYMRALPHDLAKVKDDYISCIEELKNDLKQDLEIEKKIDQVQAIYATAMKDPPFKSTQVRISDEFIQIKIETEISSEEIDSIFDKVKLSNICKHMICYGQFVKQKIYKPDPLESPIKDKEMVKEPLEKSKLNTIFFTISLSTIYQVSYNVDDGFIKITVRNQDRQEFEKEVRRLFPDLIMSFNIIGVKCHLNLYPTKPNIFSLQYHYLLHYTVTQSNVYQFFLNESTQSYAEKNNYNFRHRPEFVREGMRFDRRRGNKEEGKFAIETVRSYEGDYIHLSLSAVSIPSIYRILSTAIPTICHYYKENIVNKSPLAKLYMIKGIDIDEKKDNKIEIRNKLQDEWPEIFTQAYLDKIEKKKLVITTTDPDQVKIWKEETIRASDVKAVSRKVLPYPPKGKTLFWFTTSNPNAPYPGYAEYEGNPIPQSFPSDVSAAKGTKEETKPYLSEGSIEFLPNSLTTLVDAGLERRGTERGKDSLYYALNEVTGKYKNVKNFMSDFANLRPEIFKQQLYDFSNREIRKMLKSDYLDSYLYISGYEELFGVDVYVILLKGKNQNQHEFEIPRHKYMYVKNKTPRKAVLLYKISSGLEYPQYELIVESKEEENTSSSSSEEKKELQLEPFPLAASTKIRDALSKCNHDYVISPLGVFVGEYVRSQTHPLDKFKLSSQYIDATGKVRCFTVSEGPTIFCLPSEPRNLPFSRDIQPATLEWIKKNFGNDYKGKTNLGVWFSTRDDVLYVRVDDDLERLNIPVLGSDPLFTALNLNSSIVKTVASMNRLTNVLNTLYYWFYDIYYLEVEDPSPEDFMEEYFGVALGDVEVTSFYDLAVVTERLPRYNKISEAFDYLAQIFPTDEKDERLVLHNKVYKICVGKLVETHAKHLHRQKAEARNKFINNYYSSIDDFIKHHKTIIVAGNEDPRPRFIDVNDSYKIRDTLPDVPTSDPIVFRMREVLYLVQYTQMEDFANALQVCETWRMNKHNVGYKAEHLKKARLPTFIYESTGNTLVPVAVESVEDTVSEDFYEMLLYGKAEKGISTEPKKFAAMLRLQ